MRILSICILISIFSSSNTMDNKAISKNKRVRNGEMVQDNPSKEVSTCDEIHPAQLTKIAKHAQNDNKPSLPENILRNDASIQRTLKNMPPDISRLLAQCILKRTPNIIDHLLGMIPTPWSKGCPRDFKPDRVLMKEDNIERPAYVATAWDKAVTVALNEARLWDTKTGKLLHSLIGHSDSVISAQFNKAGTMIITTSSDTTAKIWDVKSGVCLHTLEGHTNEVICAAFNGSGDKIVTLSFAGVAKIWDVATAKCLHTLQGATEDNITDCCIAFSVHGSRIVTASHVDDWLEVTIWDSNTAKKVAQFDGITPARDIRDIKFNENTNILFIHYDQEIEVFDTKSGKKLCTSSIGRAHSAYCLEDPADGNLANGEYFESAQFNDSYDKILIFDRLIQGGRANKSLSSLYKLVNNNNSEYRKESSQYTTWDISHLLHVRAFFEPKDYLSSGIYRKSHL